jgi:hypothetical protein
VAVLAVVAALLWQFFVLRQVGASVSASAPSGRSSPGVRAGCGIGRDGVVRSAEWSVRAADTDNRANGPHHDVHPFDRPRDDGAVGDADRLSLAHAVPFGFPVSFGFLVPFGLTETIEPSP